MTDFEFDLAIMCDADYMRLTVAVIARKLIVFNHRRNGKTFALIRMWQAYSSAQSITVHEVNALYQLKGGTW